MLLATRAEELWRGAEAAGVADARGEAAPIIIGRTNDMKHWGSSQGAQLEVYTLHSPLDAIQQR